MKTLRTFGIGLSALLLLTACSTQKIVSVPVEVKVPVPIPCPVENPPKPEWPLEKTDLATATVFEKVTHALAEIELRIGYEKQLEAALEACK